MVEGDARRWSIAIEKAIKRSQERTRGLQLGPILDAPIKAEREKATYLVCIENDTIGADERRQGLSRNIS